MTFRGLLAFKMSRSGLLRVAVQATGRFGKFAGLDVSCADFHGVNAAVLVNHAYALKIGFPTPFAYAGYVLADAAATLGLASAHDTVAHVGPLAAVFTHSCHESLPGDSLGWAR